MTDPSEPLTIYHCSACDEFHDAPCPLGLAVAQALYTLTRLERWYIGHALMRAYPAPRSRTVQSLLDRLATTDTELQADRDLARQLAQKVKP
jgi:hypothetical protein